MDKTPDKCIRFDPWRFAAKVKLLSDLLESGTDIRLRVTGASMAPSLKTGSIVTLRRVPPDQLRIGDLILFSREGKTMMLHRLIGFRQKKGCLFDKSVFITKGDAVDSRDLPVSDSDYMAKVIRIEYEGQEMAACREVELRSLRVINFFRAIYHRIRSFIVCYYARYKSIHLSHPVQKKHGGASHRRPDKKSASSIDSSL